MTLRRGKGSKKVGAAPAATKPGKGVFHHEPSFAKSYGVVKGHEEHEVKKEEGLSSGGVEYL
jgi:hypothetical protein